MHGLSQEELLLIVALQGRVHPCLVLPRHGEHQTTADPIVDAAVSTARARSLAGASWVRGTAVRLIKRPTTERLRSIGKTGLGRGGGVRGRGVRFMGNPPSQ